VAAADEVRADDAQPEAVASEEAPADAPEVSEVVEDAASDEAQADDAPAADAVEEDKKGE
jgi:hypothetical protein